MLKAFLWLLLALPALALGQTSIFTGYNGGGCSSAAVCTVTVNSPTTITASFTLTGLFNATTNRPPASWYPYPANSLWKQGIPADCRTGAGAASGPAGCDINVSTYGLSQTSSLTMAKAALGYYIGENLGQAGGNGVPFSMVITSDTNAGTPGEEDEGMSTYYSQPADPYYLIKDFEGPEGTDCYYESAGGITMAIQIPSGACWTGRNSVNNPAGGDGNMRFYDQTQGIFGGMDRGGSGAQPYACLPTSTATTPQTALSLTGQVGSSCTGERPGVDLDWGIKPNHAWDVYYNWTSPSGFVDTLGGSGDNLGTSATASLEDLRIEEFAEDIHGNVGQISRSFQASIGCVNDPPVFPNGNSDGYLCNQVKYCVGGTNAGASCTINSNCTSNSCQIFSGNANYIQYPPNGGLLYCDYTNAQIAAMQLPVWQNTMLTALCTYGEYPTVTNASENGAGVSGGDSMESELAYIVATGVHHPAYSWILGQNLGSPLCTGTATAPACPAQIPIGSGANACGSANNPSPHGYYRINCGVLYGIPPVAGDTPDTTLHENYVYGHFHYIDPCVTKKQENNVGGNQTGTCPIP